MARASHSEAELTLPAAPTGSRDQILSTTTSARGSTTLETATTSPAMQRRLARLGLTGNPYRWTARYLICEHQPCPVP